MFAVMMAGFALVAPPHPSTQNSQPNQGRTAKIERATPLRLPIKQAEQSPYYKQPCGNASHDRESDLCAQWYAADAARDSANWAFAAMLVGIVSAIGIVFALLLTVHSNWIARDSARRELRAYMTFVQIHLLPRDKKSFALQVEWINKGKTPARQASGYANFVMMPDKLPDDFAFPIPEGEDDDGGFPVGSGQSLFNACDQLMTVEMITAVARGSKRIYLWSAVDYLDVFDNWRRTELASKVRLEQYAPDPKEPDKVEINMRWDALHRHNGIDEECERKPQGHLRPPLWRRLLDAIRA